MVGVGGGLRLAAAFPRWAGVKHSAAEPRQQMMRKSETGVRVDGGAASKQPFAFCYFLLNKTTLVVVMWNKVCNHENNNDRKRSGGDPLCRISRFMSQCCKTTRFEPHVRKIPHRRLQNVECLKTQKHRPSTEKAQRHP